MPHTTAHAVDIWFEEIGDPDDPVLLLVAGHGVQLIAWPDELCWAFCDRGFRVVRFDNRDAGLSTVLGDGDEYSLSDMAGDAVAVLDALGVDRAHLVGMSMGAMIAQVAAIEHPARVASLTSVSANTGEADVGGISAAALDHVVVDPGIERDAVIEHGLAGRRIWASDRWFDEAWHRADLEAAFDRAFHYGSGMRQFHAMAASGSRAEGLAALDVPVLVVHGDVDNLVDPSGGHRTAELVAGAELLEIEDMGHGLPSQMWAQLVEAVTRLAVRTEADR